MSTEPTDPVGALRAYARELTAAAADAPAPELGVGDVSPWRPPRRSVMGLRPAPILAAFLVTVMLASGTVVGSNASVPGDALYGIDLLVEDAARRVGYSADHSEERFAEAITLSERGDVANALRAASSGFRDANEELWAARGLVAVDHAQNALGEGRVTLGVLAAAVGDLAEAAHDLHAATRRGEPSDALEAAFDRSAAGLAALAER